MSNEFYALEEAGIQNVVAYTNGTFVYLSGSGIDAAYGYELPSSYRPSCVAYGMCAGPMDLSGEELPYVMVDPEVPNTIFAVSSSGFYSDVVFSIIYPIA